MHIQEKIIVDTGFIVALFNEKDEFHELAKEKAKEVDHYTWYSSVFILHEIFWLLNKRTSRTKAIKCFETIQNLIILPDLPSNWQSLILEILRKYSDANIDLADASLVLIADRLKLGQIASVDKKDFALLRWNSGKNKFENLLFL